MDTKRVNPIMQYFAYEHLPMHLQVVSRDLCELAKKMESELPECAETSAGLRKLLEAKDCFVRASLAKKEQHFNNLVKHMQDMSQKEDRFELSIISAGAIAGVELDVDETTTVHDAFNEQYQQRNGFVSLISFSGEPVYVTTRIEEALQRLQHIKGLFKVIVLLERVDEGKDRLALKTSVLGYSK